MCIVARIVHKVAAMRASLAQRVIRT